MIGAVFEGWVRKLDKPTMLTSSKLRDMLEYKTNQTTAKHPKIICNTVI